MRLICFILSLYTLILVCTPCADGFCDGNDQHLSSVAHEDEKEDDLCSSFCICSCCGYAAVEMISLVTHCSSFSPVLPKQVFFYTPPFIKDVGIDFWQPPRIS